MEFFFILKINHLLIKYIFFNHNPLQNVIFIASLRYFQRHVQISGRDLPRRKEGRGLRGVGDIRELSRANGLDKEKRKKERFYYSSQKKQKGKEAPD